MACFVQFYLIHDLDLAPTWFFIGSVSVSEDWGINVFLMDAKMLAVWASSELVDDKMIMMVLWLLLLFLPSSSGVFAFSRCFHFKVGPSTSLWSIIICPVYISLLSSSMQSVNRKKNENPERLFEFE